MFSTEFLDLPPLAGAAGTLALPGSKSISNRVLLLASLCSGTTVIHDLLDSDDTQVMLKALEDLGCAVRKLDGALAVDGCGKGFAHKSASIFLGNAGTAMRPLAAVLAVLGGEFRLHGVQRMHERPIGDLVDALREIGCALDYEVQEGFPPLRIGKPTLDMTRPISVRGDVSSQFLTALLIALPLVSHHDIVIEVRGELISKPYVEITLALLARFGVQVHRQGWSKFTVPARSVYRSPGHIHVEADASSASYFLALGALASGFDGKQGVRVLGVGTDTIQGDLQFVDAARAMGAHINSGANWIESGAAAGDRAKLQGIDLDCNHIPDAAMTLAVMAMYAQGPTTLRNIASWRVKETDRLAAMATELRKFGANVLEGPDFLRVEPPADATHWRAACVNTYDDHRMAMCFSLLAFNPARLPVRILDPRCVAKTYPDYFEDLFSLSRVRQQDIPVICVDGPTASGKGTLAAALAKRLGYHYLDSGALYRLCGLAVRRAGLAMDLAQEQRIAKLAGEMALRFDQDRVWLFDEDVSDAIRTEQAGMDASLVSAFPGVRAALLDLQRSFARLPGLVADGRDMGSVVFPNAKLKIHLSASAEERATRRHKQLISKGISVSIATLLADLQERDSRDSNRSAAPLRVAEDAKLLDNSALSIDLSVQTALDWWQSKQPFGESVAKG